MAGKRTRPPDVEDCNGSQGSPRPNKQPCTLDRAKGHDGYHPGSITRMAMTNFMNYNYASFSPGPRLNLIIGPNGNGKSTIVCAMCLGLGGHPKLLERANRLSDFINRDNPSQPAIIEIDLAARDPDQRTRIKRVIKGSTSKWYINDTEKDMNEVLKQVQALNIKLDNLTQFLPQDKIKSFSSLNSMDLLLQTEEVILDPETVKLHAKLIEKGETTIAQAKELEKLQRKVEHLEEQNSALENDVERHQHKQKLLRKAAEYKMAIPFKLHSKKQEDGHRVKREEEAAKKALQEAQKAIAPLEKQIMDLSKEKQESEAALARMEKAVQRQADRVQQQTDKIEKAGHEYEGLEQEERQLQNRRQNRERELNSVRNKLESFQAELESMQDPKELQAQMNEKTKEAKAIDAKYHAVVQEKETHAETKQICIKELQHVQHAIASFQGFKERRMQNLVRMGGAEAQISLDIHKWIESNQQRLKGNVYLVALHIDISNPLYARYLEMTLPRWFLLSFVCEFREDNRLLTHEFSEKRKRHFSIITRDAEMPVPQRLYTDDQLRSFGMVAWMDQTFEAPDIVKAALLDQVPAQKIGVGTDETEKIGWTEVNKKLPAIQTFFTPNARYMFKKSKYGRGDVSSKINRLMNAVIFAGVEDSSAGVQLIQLREKETQLKQRGLEVTQKFQAIESQERKWNVDRERCRQERQELSLMITKHGKTIRNMTALKSELNRLEQANDAADRERIIKRKRLLIRRRAQDMIEMKALMTEWVDNATRQTIPILTKDDLLRRQRQLSEEQKDRKQEHEAKHRLHIELQSLLEKIKQEITAIKKEALSLEAAFKQEYANEGEETRVLVKNLCDNNEIEALQAQADEAENDANDIHADPSVQAQYAQRNEEIKKEKSRLEHLTSSQATAAAEIKSAKDRWLRPLRERVSEVNNRFKHYCEFFGIAGEVLLEESKDENNFREYAIQLQCSFRSGTEMQRLSDQKQSGGERAVITALYLMALQSMNQCPFRVVDEIDQGMDKTNQMKVLYKMLDETREESSPQNFMITPKYIEGMVPEDADNMDVFLIMNGPRGLPQKQWNEAVGDRVIV